MNELIATKSIIINAPATKVWAALVTPELVKQYMFGVDVVSDWQKGSQILYRGEWQGKPFEDKGLIVEIEPNKVLKSTYYSPLSGKEDKPENYNLVTYELTPDGNKTKLTITQTNNATQGDVDKSEANWAMVLDSIKKLLEG